ncbi:rhodanese-like domain-containing protein [Streptococcus sp. X16XC17]|uniref:rhodanese-like domain-containing protein n=1 Tax=unclassified Streptococcus TaxID=2608887 RepID=UPI00066FE48C|nr:MULTISPECIES: rhodanese-like domain-containing protein [unclassified Streptococcus]TCD45925.1 rhodanese-like domain-containing protein [Streptococcus sp. X16XC17]
MFRFFKKIFPKSSESISTDELEAILKDEKVRLLDVRTPKEYRSGHIRQARSFPLDLIPTYQESKDGKIYVICQSGMRSKRAASMLAAKGYEVINVRGGMSAYHGKIVG